jgi:hypothetical protein
MRKLIALATLSTVAGLGAAAGLAGTASAAGGSGIITRPAIAYSGPTTNSDQLAYLSQNAIVETACWTKGQTVDGSHIWIGIRHNGDEAYVNRAFIDAPAGLEHC